jgi:hypothetical protein
MQCNFCLVLIFFIICNVDVQKKTKQKKKRKEKKKSIVKVNV